MPNMSAEDDARYVTYFREGLTADRIALAEGMSIHTVKSRIQRLYQRYGARTRGQFLALYADEQHGSDLRADLVAQRTSQLLTAWLSVQPSHTTVSDALRLAFDVRIAPPTQTRLRLERLIDVDRDRLVSIAMTLAALVPLDRSPDALLRWLLDRQLNRSAATRPANGGSSTND